jgi:hypothetical protein
MCGCIADTPAMKCLACVYNLCPRIHKTTIKLTFKYKVHLEMQVYKILRPVVLYDVGM